jgi:hypothetical protein
MLRKRIALLIGMAVAFAVGMLFYEAFLRFSGSSGPSVVESDETFGLRLKRDMHYIFVNEGFSLGKINHYGYMGPGYPPEKPEGVVRIALMGDSYVAGHHMFDRHHFRSLIERDLNDLPGVRVEVLNFGFPAINFEQMYVYYEVFARRFSPDYVLYFIGTSSLNNPVDEVGPRLKLEADTLQIDNSFRKTGAFARVKRLDLLRQLGLFSLIRKAKQIYGQGSGPEIVFDKFYWLAKGGRGDEKTRKEPEEKPKRIAINHAVVERLASDNRRAADGLEESATSILVIRDGLPRTFIDFAGATGLELFDPNPGLDSLEAAGIDPHYWKGSQRNGHWNQYAHRVVAAYLTRKLTPLLDTEVSGL